MHKGSLFSTRLKHLLCLVFLIIAICKGVRDYFSEVLICISLMMQDVEHLFNTCWPTVCLLWKNVSSGLFPIKKFFFYWVVWVPCILWVLISYQVYGLSNEISKRYPFIKRKTGSSHVAWWGKDPALRQLWCRRQLQRGFDPWPGNFHMPQVWPRKKKEKQMPTTLMQILLWRTSANK